MWRQRHPVVVICFHFTIFVVLGTTGWKYYLIARSCDLLSFYYLCRTRNNADGKTVSLAGVVICFHFTIFVVLGTTNNVKPGTAECCDLLSFYYLCRTRNNFHALYRITYSVVICFHFTIFVVLGTTPSFFQSAFASCDLLSFYYLCRTRNNTAQGRQRSALVVICFHFTIFVVLGTTQSVLFVV